jgi:catechol 2,3-dioxygenase-like lactoylglutathione lyase family enzyme
MLIDKLEHYNIVTEKLDETIAFYVDVIGLANGYRPNFDFPGAWLYAGEEAVVHLMQLGENRDFGSGSIDHVAFRGTDSQKTNTFLTNLDIMNVEYIDRFIEDANIYQVFVTDPNGVKVEINFHQ